MARAPNGRHHRGARLATRRDITTPGTAAGLARPERPGAAHRGIGYEAGRYPVLLLLRGALGRGDHEAVALEPAHHELVARTQRPPVRGQSDPGARRHLRFNGNVVLMRADRFGGWVTFF